MLSDRARNLKPSFITQILSIAQDPKLISFAGGLPNSAVFPKEELSMSTQWVLRHESSAALQYASTQGFLPLREWISSRYKQTVDMEVDPNSIIIVSGAQQGIDLVAKLFLNTNDAVLVENPTYLGALESFSIYKPKYLTINLSFSGINSAEFEQILLKSKPKLTYLIPSFQNPTGYRYSRNNRKELAILLKQHQHFLLEDDPYFELAFNNKPQIPIKAWADEQVFLLGSFSKSVSPGIRLGWICAPSEFVAPLLLLKQASDLHSNNFMQHVLYHFLSEYDFASYISNVTAHYNMLANQMHAALARELPRNIAPNKVKGGMFYWLTLPSHISTTNLFDLAVKKGVAFVPGEPFYAHGDNTQSLRLNFTNSNLNMIDQGIKILSEVIRESLQK
jgi:2-aminoadipate transaminase